MAEACEITYKCPLTCGILTPILNPAGGGSFVYVESTGTIELDEVKAYYMWIKPDGTLDETCCVLLMPNPLVVKVTYAEIDSIINPDPE